MTTIVPAGMLVSAINQSTGQGFPRRMPLGKHSELPPGHQPRELGQSGGGATRYVTMPDAFDWKNADERGLLREDRFSRYKGPNE